VITSRRAMSCRKKMYVIVTTPLKELSQNRVSALSLEAGRCC
jgi:hypothetical protein